MKSNRGYLILILLAAAIVNACAVQGEPPPAFEAQPIPAGSWRQKADYLYFILDASSSMGAAHKLETAKGIIAHFEQTMPPLELKVALRSFGHDPQVSDSSSTLLITPQVYAPGLIPGALAKLSGAGGTSPMQSSLARAAVDLENVRNPVALIIISDGKDIHGDPLVAAKAIGKAHGDRLCIYTVLVGDAVEGRMLLRKMAGITPCGRALSAENLSTGLAMNGFVNEVLLAGKLDSDGDGIADDADRCPDTAKTVKVDPTGCPLDSDRDGVPDYQDQCPETAHTVKVGPAGCPPDGDLDGVPDYRDRCPDTAQAVKVDPAGCPPDRDSDGVPDYQDQCPNTAQGIKVDAKGCPSPAAILSATTSTGTYVFKGIQFEAGKSDLKTGSYPILDAIAEALKAKPGLNVEIQGHTDDRGKHEDNVDLSQRRAETVKAYLVVKGIDGERLAARGYGPDRPVVSNKTLKGRATNRRVEFKPLQ